MRFITVLTLNSCRRRHRGCIIEAEYVRIPRIKPRCTNKLHKSWPVLYSPSHPPPPPDAVFWTGVPSLGGFRKPREMCKVPAGRKGFLALDRVYLRTLGEFMWFLCFLAHKRAMDFFAAIGQANPSHKELCQQRGAFFYQHRSRVGVACAQACALRIGGACSTTPASATSGRQRARVAGGPRCELGWIIASL